MPLRVHVFCAFVMLVAAPATAQERSLDARAVRALSRVDAPVVTVPLRGADWSAYPAFALAPAGLWMGSLATGNEYDAAYRLAASEALAFSVGSVLKRVFRRGRPYLTVPGVEERMNVLDRRFASPRHSLPSGHAALSFALATSISLSYPRAAVALPSLTWAALVAASRVWLGVHYPSDVLAGALLGAGAGAGVHALRETITPPAWQDDDAEPDVPAVIAVRLQF
jgi:membrane-associated phospholipid phosphatase